MFDMKQLQKQVNAVLAYSQELPCKPQTDKLMQTWYDAKSKIIKAFGNKLIYEVEDTVTFNLSKEEQDQKIDDFISRCERVFHNKPLAWFLLRNKDSFFDNVVIEETTCPSGDKITAGMKLLKAFKFFEDDETTLKALQTEASMIIQENKIEGVLCFSVHPLDYLSMSENNYNWRSCHALDGEYRSGNLSYMCDNNTIVCYLRGKDTAVHIPRFPDDVLWNSKKWRMLIFLSNTWNSIFAGRQYPFTSAAGLDMITPYLHKALKLDDNYYFNWSAWHNDVLTDYTYQNGLDDDWGKGIQKTVVLGRKYCPLEELVTDGEHSRHFNDLLRSSCYVPFYQWNRYLPSYHNEHFLIGAEAPCIACGENFIDTTDSMLCEDCYQTYVAESDEDTAICEYCGRQERLDDMYSTVDGSLICPTCAETACVTCDDCGQLVFTEDANYDEETEAYYCDRCYCYARLRDRRNDE